MDFKSLLAQLDQLNEATEKTKTGLKHTAEPGGYGRKDDEDEEGNKVKAASTEKKGRGRPKKATQTSGEDKKYDFSAFGVKHGKDVKLPKYDKKKTTKHSLKEYFDAIDQEMIAEAEQIQIKPANQMPKLPGQTSIGQKPAVPGQQPVAGQPQKNTQVIAQGNKTLGTVDNPQLAQQIKQSIGKGEMTLMPEEQMDEADYSAKKARAGKDIGKPGKAFSKIAKDAGQRYGSKAAGERVAGAVLAKLRKTNEGDMPPNDSNLSPIGEGKKPDFLDLDKDGNKKESMKKAAQDKKKVKEGMDHRIKAARHAGKAHALGKQGYNCTYDDMGEARSYHEGYKEGLDECYGQMPIQGYVGEANKEVADMASYGAHTPTMEDDVEEGNAFTGALAKTPAGGKFSLGGKTFKDTSNIEESPFAFESLEQQLNALLEAKEEVAEGMTVSISKGQQGQPDSVSVNAQDAEADQLLSIIKQAGLGLFGGDEVGQTPQSPAPMTVDVDGGEGPQADIEVVDDHDDMLSLIRKMTGQGPATQAGDYEEEGGEEAHSHDEASEEACEACGESACGCDDNKEPVVDEDETMDQREYEVAEDESGGDDSEESDEVNSDAVRDAALAQAAGKNFADTDSPLEEGGDGAEAGTDAITADDAADEADAEEEDLDESYANSDDDTFESDIDFMTKVISGGLNKQKSTGQTTIPVVAGQNDRMGYNTNESVNDWKKLAGIK